jgi:hypothetical protein
MDEQTIIECAGQLQMRELDPIPKHLILRDILGKPPDEPEVLLAANLLSTSKWIQRLTVAQWGDGSWGRLHSADSAARQAIPTTEVGVERGVSLGLDASHPIMADVSSYLQSILRSEKTVRDPSEKNRRWSFGVKLFAASTLAQVRPESKELDEPWDMWCDIAYRSVESGEYDSRAELAAHREFSGLSVQGSYFRLSSRYALALLGSRAKIIPVDVEEAIFRWIWQRKSGIGYYGPRACDPPRSDSPGTLELWVRTQELLSVFPSWKQASASIIEWLWAKLTPEGWWDFGKRWDRGVVLPYSENWGRREARSTDWTVRLLILSLKALDEKRQVAG